MLISCAQTSPLTGGERDRYAPAIDSAKTTPYNGQINFVDDQIIMKFNEYIKLNNPSDNIIIIPPLKEKPTIEAKNKKLVITFNEKLEENTTYAITFNGAIQDITENNDSVFQYVFSTGSYIDSLEVIGKVKDAFLNTPEPEMLVALYPKELEADFDSIPLKFKPTYLAQTDKSGQFELNYLKDGIYYMFGINDRNKNLLYDQGEVLAFLGEKEFNLTPDARPYFELRSFKERTTEVYLEDLNFDFPGRVEVILSNPTDTFEISSNLPLVQEETGQGDSLIFWLAESPVPKMRFYVNVNGEIDTIKPIYKNIPDKVEEVDLKHQHNIIKGELLPNENLSFLFTEPIKSIDADGIHFYDIDSNEVKIDSITYNVREVEFNTFGSTAERIVIDSAAVHSYYGRENAEKIELTFKNHNQDYYGALIVTMDTVFSDPVIVHLITDKGELISTSKFQEKMSFEKLIPGNYQLRLIFDVDNNGEWTTGSLKEGRIPEKVVYNSESIKVKSKWEKEIDWVLKPEM